jgi:drug/metabolite transporter (DMT)-like permease
MTTTDSRATPWLAVAGLALSALVWGLSWWPVRHAHALGVQPLWTTALVYVPGTLAVVLARPAALVRVLRSRQLWLVALSAGGANVCFNLGVALGDVVRVVLLFYLMPVWATLLARPLLGERVGPAGWLRLAVALCGALVVLWPHDGGLPLPRQPADWLGLCGGAFFALNNVLLRRCADEAAPPRMLAMFCGGLLCGAALAWLSQRLGWAPALPAPDASWLLPVGLLGLAMLAGSFGLQYGAARLPAALTAVIMMLEIVFASLSSALLGASHPGPQALAGGLLIALGVVFGALAEARAERRAGAASRPGEEHNDGVHGAAHAARRRPR